MGFSYCLLLLFQGVFRYWTPTIKKLLKELSQAKSEKESALKSISQRLIGRFCEHQEKWRQLVSATAGMDKFMFYNFLFKCQLLFVFCFKKLVSFFLQKMYFSSAIHVNCCNPSVSSVGHGLDPFRGEHLSSQLESEFDSTLYKLS